MQFCAICCIAFRVRSGFVLLLLAAHAEVVVGYKLLYGAKLYLDFLIQLDACGLLVGGLGKGEAHDDAFFALLSADLVREQVPCSKSTMT